jgi:RNA polymerase sigma-70 factor (ECF subfamily)
VRELLEQFVPPVYRFALRLTGGDRHAAEDLSQETLLRAWRYREKLREDRLARVLLFRITANLWRDQLRRERVRRTRRPPAPAPALPDRGAQEREEADRALRALDALPERQREVLYLSVCEGLSIAQIAEVLQIGGGAVKSSLSLGRQRLRATLRQPQGEEVTR